MHATLYTANHNPAALYTRTYTVGTKQEHHIHIHEYHGCLKFHTIWLKQLSQITPSSYGLRAKECANVLVNQQQ